MSNTFTHKEVKDILYNVYETYDLQNTAEFGMRFESRLNNKWLNWNNWANENRLWDFHEEDIESFIN